MSAAGTPEARSRPRLDRKRALVLLALFLVTLAASRSCQQAQIRVSKEQAVTTARRQVDFRPRRMQIRLVRQGLTARPYWAVSLSIPRRDGTFERLTTVRVDANTGKVAAVNVEGTGR